MILLITLIFSATYTIIFIFVLKQRIKKDAIVYSNGLTRFDIERVSLLIDSVLLCVKARLDKATLRDIIHSIYNTIKIDLERSIERNKAIVERNLNKLSER